MSKLPTMGTGGPAFPSPTGNLSQDGGITVRDWFAGQILAGWNEDYRAAANKYFEKKDGNAFWDGMCFTRAQLVEFAYVMADDAMRVRAQ